MGLHVEVPLVALLGLMHLLITRFASVLGGCGRCNQRGIHDGVDAQQQLIVFEQFVNGLQDLFDELVLFKQVAKTQDRALIRRCAIP